MTAVCWAVICARVWSDRVRRDPHSSCKSSPAPLLKMEQHTIPSVVHLSSAFSQPPSCFHPSSLLYCLSVLSPVVCLGRRVFPILSVRVPAFAVDCEAPRSLTDGESVTGSVTGPSGSRWPQDQHWWSDKWLNEPRLASYKFLSVRFVTQNTTFTKNHNIVYSS